MIACGLFTTYEDWPEVLEQLYGFSDRIESPQEGLAFIEIDEAEARGLAALFNIAVGLASTQEAAHLLALCACSGEVVADEQRIAKLPVNLLESLGLSAQNVQRLHWLGVEALGELRKWSKAQLSLYLGPESKTIIRYLHGPYQATVARYSPTKVLAASFSFEEPVLEPGQLEPMLSYLCHQLNEELSDRAASRISLTAISQGLQFRASRLSKDLLNDAQRLERLAQLALQDAGVLGLEVSDLRLELSGLYRPALQGTLWRQRQEAGKAVEVVERRFPGAMLRFEEVNPHIPVSTFQFRLLKVREEVSDGSATRRQSAPRPARLDRPAAYQLRP